MSINSVDEQGSEAWRLARVGKCTASMASAVLATIKNGEAATRRNYRSALIVERLTGLPVDTYESLEMRWGRDQEPFARICYESVTGNIVHKVGFIAHPELMAGASPDGEIAGDGLLEAKCPNTATHIDTLLKGMSPDHIPQIQFQLWITGRAFCDFVSYDPRMPERMQLYVQRIERDNAYIERLEKEVRKFLAEVGRVIAELEAKVR